MSAVAAPSAKRIAWLRRRRAAAAAWSDFRHDRAGMIGLVILVVFVAMALAAPLIVPKSELQAVNAIDNPVWASPSEFSPDGDRQPRPQRLGPVRLGRADQPAGRPRRDRDGDADRHGRGRGRRLLRRAGRRRADADHRVVPRDPVPAARDRARRGPRPVAHEHHLRHRHHVVAVDRAADPLAGADAEGAALRRPQPRAGRLGRAPDGPPHHAQHLRADPRQHDADRADRDPVGDHALVPRARRPDAARRGGRCSRRRSNRAR